MASISPISHTVAVTAALIVLSSDRHGLSIPSLPQYQAYQTLDQIARIPWIDRRSGQHIQDPEHNRRVRARDMFGAGSAYLTHPHCGGIEIQQTNNHIYAIFSRLITPHNPQITVYRSTIAAMRQEGKKIMTTLAEKLNNRNAQALTLDAIKAYLAPELDSIRTAITQVQSDQAALATHARSLAQSGQTLATLGATLSALHNQATTSTEILLRLADRLDSLGQSAPAPKAQPVPAPQTTTTSPAPAPKPTGKNTAIPATFDPAKHFRGVHPINTIDDLIDAAQARAAESNGTIEQAVRAIWMGIRSTVETAGKPHYLVAARFLADLVAHVQGRIHTIAPTAPHKDAPKPQSIKSTTSPTPPAPKSVSIKSMAADLGIEQEALADLVATVREIGSTNLSQDDIKALATELVRLGANYQDIKVKLAIKRTLSYFQTL